MNTRTFALVFGIVFLLVGVAGFIPGLTKMPHPGHPTLIVDENYGLLLGLFPVNLLHNLYTSVFRYLGARSFRSSRGAKAYVRGVAIIYGVLTVAGLFPGPETLFGLCRFFRTSIPGLHGMIAMIAAHFRWVHRDAASSRKRHHGVSRQEAEGLPTSFEPVPARGSLFPERSGHATCCDRNRLLRGRGRPDWNRRRAVSSQTLES